MERKLSRRNILGAAGALAGGSALAGAATAAAPVIGAVTASDGDTLALSLFRQWIAAANEYDRQFAAEKDLARVPAGDLMTEIEDRILEISCGAVSLALKTHFVVRQDHAAWVGETRLLRIREYFEDDPDWETRFAVALLRDAAVVVPEILEVAAPVLHEDAALIDGCSRFGVLFRILYPVAIPGLVVSGFFAFVVSWGDYLFVSILSQSNETQTLPIGLQTFMSSLEVQWGLITAGTVLAIVPTVIFFSIVQRRLVSGLTAGAVKS